MNYNIFQESIEKLREHYKDVYFEVIEVPDATDKHVKYTDILNLYTIFVPAYETTGDKLFVLANRFTDILLTLRYSKEQITKLAMSEEWENIHNELDAEVMAVMKIAPMGE